jgi:hypothetical protein
VDRFQTPSVRRPKSTVKKNNFFKNAYYCYISSLIKLKKPSPKKFANDCLLAVLTIFNKLVRSFTWM